MSQTVSGTRLRSHFTRPEWGAPRPYGPDGWTITSHDRQASVIVSACEFADAHYSAPGLRFLRTWVHASIARAHETPSYSDLTLLKLAVFGEDGEAYQVFAPRSRHVNIHPNALHLWGRADGEAVLPDFRGILPDGSGTI